MAKRDLLPTRRARPLGLRLERRWGLPVADPSVYFLVGIGLMGAAASLLLLG